MSGGPISFDSAVAMLVAMGFSREKAEGAVRLNMGTAAPAPLAPDDDADAREERSIVRDADKQMRALGFRVINTSQPRHAKYITPGVPDRFYFHRARGLGFAWEAKTPRGVQSPAQRDFQEDCDACGFPYVLGTDRDLYAWLVARGIAVYDGDTGKLITPPGAAPTTPLDGAV